jgi:hypothetical protein
MAGVQRALLFLWGRTRRHGSAHAPRVFGALVGAAVAALMVRDASAAACCVSATSFGVGRLLIWEDFAVGLQLGHARLLGQWDENGHLHLNPQGYSEGITHAQLWAIVRLHDRAELQGWLPALENEGQLSFSMTGEWKTTVSIQSADVVLGTPVFTTNFQFHSQRSPS